jgi:hypothetical protein
MAASRSCDGDAAIGGNRQIHRHPHARERAAQHHPFAMQIDNAQAIVRRVVGSFKTRWQRERVEPPRARSRACTLRPGAARPGSGSAGFHLTPRNSRRAVAARLPQPCHRAVAITLKSLVKVQ